MSDRAFFAVMGLIAIVMVALALVPYRNLPPRGALSGGAIDAPRGLIIADGRNLFRFVAADQSDVDVIENDGAQPTYVRITQSPGRVSDFADRGVHLPLAADLERSWAGKLIEVTVRARAAGEIGASQFEAAYSVGRLGGSGWQRFPLTQEFADYTFTYAVPQIFGEELTLDYLGVRVVLADKRRSVDISSVTFRVLGAAAPPG
jgi:hypothetical protein